MTKTRVADFRSTMRFGVLFVLVSSVFSLRAVAQVEAGLGSVRMTLAARDVVLGEFSVMSDRPLALIVANHGEHSIRLPSGNSSGWMAESPYWAIHIEGPIDSRCKEYEAGFISRPPVGADAHVGIGAGEEKKLSLPGLGIGEEGEYRLWIEYRGDLAPNGYLAKRMRTAEVVLRIGPPTATEQEVVQVWRTHNPNRPWCLFPAGVAPGRHEATFLIEEYPASLYAGWEIWKRLQSHTGGFPGRPSAANPADFFKVIREGGRVLYDERLGAGTSGEEVSIRGEDAALWRIEKIGRFLSAHPDFPQAHEMMLRVAMDYIGLGKYQKAERELSKIISSWPGSAAADRAASYLSLVRREARP